MNQERLQGGNVTSVVRIGGTVRRRASRWTPTVHALFLHLERVGFSGAPRARGFDDHGREVLIYINGVAGVISRYVVRPPDLWSDAILSEATTFLRRYHDATASFCAPPDATWQTVYPNPAAWEVICHSDFAPYNCIYADGHLKAVIDFDTAGPGPRIWDVAYAAYRFVPLMPDDARASVGVPTDIEIGDRLRLFCDAYGPDRWQRHDLPMVIVERLQATRTMLLAGAAAGEPGYEQLLAEGGHVEGLERDLAFVRDHAHHFRQAIRAG